MARVIAWCALCLLARVAFAQPVPDDRATQANLRYETGMAHFQLEEYDRAILEWESGFRIKPVPQFLYNIAQAYRLSKQYEKAASFYRKYLNMDPKAPNKGDVDRHLATLARLIADQKKASNAPPTGTLATDTGKPRSEPVKPRAEPVKPPPQPEPVKPVARPEPVKPIVQPEPIKPQPARADLTVTATPKDDRPMTKKGWFWGVIGGVGVVVVAGVVLGVVLGTQTSDGTTLIAPARF